MTFYNMKRFPPILRLASICAVTILIVACSGGADDQNSSSFGKWELVLADLPGALMSIWGTASDDIWVVGADPGDGAGPAVVHYDGEVWKRLSTGHSGDLWWVYGFKDGPIYMGGTNGMVLRYKEGIFERMQTPGSGTVYGIWGIAPDDLWAVGGNVTDGAFAWRFLGTAWTPAAGFPEYLSKEHSMFKVWGKTNADVWIVGTGGTTIHYDTAEFVEHDSNTKHQLFTVHGNQETVIAVGGLGDGAIIENTGDAWVTPLTPEEMPYLMGIHSGRYATYAVGVQGSVLHKTDLGWETVDTGLDLPEHLHAVWQDEKGDVWAVGGQVIAPPLVDGVVIRGIPNH